MALGNADRGVPIHSALERAARSGELKACFYTEVLFFEVGNLTQFVSVYLMSFDLCTIMEEREKNVK